MKRTIKDNFIKESVDRELKLRERVRDTFRAYDVRRRVGSKR